MVSRIFDHPRVPRSAVEYIVYHEMLHLKHPVRLRGSRRCVHSAEFQAEEKLFPQLEEVKQFLRASVPKSAPTVSSKDWLSSATRCKPQHVDAQLR